MIKVLAAAALLAFGSTHALAWGGKAHRMIGSLAEKRLRSSHPAVAEQIRVLLGPGLSLAEISTCADSIRDALSRPKDPFPDHCLISKQEAAAMFPSTMSWHFVNIPVPASADRPTAHPNAVLEKACAASSPCITQQIEYFVNRLSNKSLDNKTRAIALMFIVHLVGDIHQPLHALARNNDRGGNDVVVQIGDHRSKLHSLWDSYFMDRVNESEVERISVRGRGNPKLWAWESYDLARQVVYADVPERSSSMDRPIVLPEGYRAVATNVVKRRIQTASVRLANLLAKALED